MSLQSLLRNQSKPWLNARLNNIEVDGELTIGGSQVSPVTSEQVNVNIEDADGIVGVGVLTFRYTIDPDYPGFIVEVLTDNITLSGVTAVAALRAVYLTTPQNLPGSDHFLPVLTGTTDTGAGLLTNDPTGFDINFASALTPGSIELRGFFTKYRSPV